MNTYEFKVVMEDGRTTTIKVEADTLLAAEDTLLAEHTFEYRLSVTKYY